jgi:isocitrate lyase
MAAYTGLQEAEFRAEDLGCSATRHQREVGTGYFYKVSEVISLGRASNTMALGDSRKPRSSSDRGPATPFSLPPPLAQPVRG